ncbi:HHL301Wp [Eremothecium sinecaudum]|uniref:HHL301Wp n=1 Tax=Eremothecium sinecaudum TaxID=45286 RepID=A0A0X8HVV4_9SACH|nr:HHL301Wp [Eremothecium sinecaudum]AMD22469.1 HHL301Wp [Eremothecium sinecaudum]
MEDPFLAYSPFRDHTNLVLRHGHEVLVSFLVYHFLIYRWLAPTANRLVFGDFYLRSAKRDKINFDIHSTSMVQALVCLALIMPVMKLPVDLELYSYYNEYVSLVSAHMMGYFLWDFYVCARYCKFFGIGFLGHAVGSLMVTTCTLRPSYQQWVGKFLVFEASTPLVNVNWYISQLSRAPSTRKRVIPARVNFVNGILLFITFFCVRIVWGTIALVLLDYQVWKQWSSDTPVFLGLLVPSVNLLMTVLNFYWFSKMVTIAKKTYNASKKVSKLA